MDSRPDRRRGSDTPAWLRQLGFLFNPFQYLEASDDRRLSSYLVDHELLQLALDGAPALIFAPAGGGKTTMRMAATYAHWLGRDYARRCAITYLPHLAEHTDGAAHQAGIAQAGATALLIGLLHFPRRLLDLDSAGRAAVATFLDAALPAPLSYYLAQLGANEDLAEFGFRLEKSYRLPPPDPPARLEAACAALEASRPAETPRLAPADRFELLQMVVLDILAFEQLVVQLDNLDAIAETIASPEAMADRMAWPLAQAAGWAERGVLLKAFLPSELEMHLAQRFPDLLAGMPQGRVHWTPELLSELLRKRVHEATGGAFSSLDAISSPQLSNVEGLIVETALPLPREAILLTCRLLASYAERTAGGEGQIEPADLVAARSWYADHAVDPGPLVGI